MKKKLLLIALPALMVLSGCSNALVEQPVKDNNANIMLEDNLAHEELFGGAKLAPKKLGEPDEDPIGNPGWTKMPKVGVQFKSYQKAETDYYAVRYVAAIADTAGMTATWTRGVSEKNSNQIKAMSGGHVSSAKYDTLNDGNTPVNASDEGAGLEKFIVYTMYDIPASQDESYIVAYLTLSKEGETSFSTRAIATQIDGSHCFSFDIEEDLEKDGYFMQTSSGNIIPQDEDGDNTDPNNDSKDNALFSNISFSADKKFGLFRFTESVFQFYGFSTFMESTSASYIKSTTIDQYCEMHLAGEYTFYVNKYNQVYTAPVDVDVTFSLTPSDHWKEAGAIFYLYGFNSVDDNGWVRFNQVGETGVYTAHAEHWSFAKMIYVRKNPSNDTADWEGKWTQSSDIDVNFGALSHVMGADEWWG